jgi:predicted RNA-binding protein (virulence factor B family)
MSEKAWKYSLASEVSWEQAKSVAPIGFVATGTVVDSQPFGVFVDIGLPAIAIIDLIQPALGDGAMRLPRDRSLWPKPGDFVRGRVVWFREDSREIDLEWLPWDAEP